MIQPTVKRKIKLFPWDRDRFGREKCPWSSSLGSWFSPQKAIRMGASQSFPDPSCCWISLFFLGFSMGFPMGFPMVMRELMVMRLGADADSRALDHTLRRWAGPGKATGLAWTLDVFWKERWRWVKTYMAMDQYLLYNTIFRGMNIHFNPAIFWCEQKRGTIGFDTLPYCYLYLVEVEKNNSWLVLLEHELYFSIQLGISSSQLMNEYIFLEG